MVTRLTRLRFVSFPVGDLFADADISIHHRSSQAAPAFRPEGCCKPSEWDSAFRSVPARHHTQRGPHSPRFHAKLRRKFTNRRQTVPRARIIVGDQFAQKSDASIAAFAVLIPPSPPSDHHILVFVIIKHTDVIVNDLAPANLGNRIDA